MKRRRENKLKSSNTELKANGERVLEEERRRAERRANTVCVNLLAAGLLRLRAAGVSFFLAATVYGRKIKRVVVGARGGFKEPWLSQHQKVHLGASAILPSGGSGWVFYYHQQLSLFCHLCKRWSFDPGLCLRPHWVFVALITSPNARVGKEGSGEKKPEKNPYNSSGSLSLLPS